MTSDARVRWERIEALLDAALDGNAGDREQLLAQARQVDPDAAAQLEQLLDALGSAEHFLPQPVQDVAAGLIDSLVRQQDGEPDDRAPRIERAGPYRLIREIGRGGMGAVYLAERDDDEYRRQVAVKIVGSAAIPNLRPRFLAERQILASLDHPNIARLYDGGTIADGTPYLVMEYIDGRRIDTYCDDHRLTVPARLALFDEVCAAVEFAHQKLIVHRDLKPANVLVTNGGTVKLLDFGVAKLLDDPVDPASAVTRTGARAMTPEYASPEQLRGGPISTSTDVYALGLLLYELLTGRRAYELRGRSPGEIERIVREQEPLKPSAAAAASGDEQDAGGVRADTRSSPESERRGATIDQLKRRLIGDLDTIVLTALRKEPEHRYQSVQHLRDDIRSYLAGMPVAARPTSWSYRAGKFVRRNLVAVAGAALLIVTLSAGLAGTLWQARSASHEADRARQVRDFVAGLFESADPDSTLGRSVTAKELLDSGAARLASNEGLEPALRADMLNVIGRIYRQLGLYTEARPLLEEALALRESLGSSAENDRAESARDLSSVLSEIGEHARAESLARAVVAYHRDRAASESIELANGLSALAVLVAFRGDTIEADRLFHEAIAIDRHLFDSAALATHLGDQGTALWRRKKYEEAQRAQEEALAIRRALYGDRHTLVAVSLLDLGTVHLERGEFPRAEELMREGLDLQIDLLGEAHPQTARTLNNLGDVLGRQGKLDESEAIHRRALAARRKAYGDSHISIAESLNNIAILYYRRGDIAHAAELMEEVVGRWRAIRGPSHPEVLQVTHNLGIVRWYQGDSAGAERIYRETLALRRQIRGEEHPDVAESLLALAFVFGSTGRGSEAEAHYRQALGIFRRTLGEQHPQVASVLVPLGHLMMDRGDYAAAEPLLREALSIRAAVMDSTSTMLANTRLHLGQCLARLGRFAEADSLMALGITALTAQLGPQDPQTQRARHLRDELASMSGSDGRTDRPRDQLGSSGTSLVSGERSRRGCAKTTREAYRRPW